VQDVVQPAAVKRLESKQAAYEPPQIEVLGTVEELTMGGPAGPNDLTLTGSVVSDRRLKEPLAPVRGRVVLDRLVLLPVL
jgi:hypothetical protein